PAASVLEQWLLVLGADMPEFGIVVEDVHEVTWVRTDAVLPPARAAREIRREWIRGVTENAVVILDGRAVLNDEQFHIDLAET
nr:chemotaxis protein CheW [Planctomycetota bacterium]